MRNDFAMGSFLLAPTANAYNPWDKEASLVNEDRKINRTPLCSLHIRIYTYLCYIVPVGTYILCM
jgi:hypothetical protein